MGLQTRNKISVSYHMSSMADIIFLLLIFFMITSTLIHPTALKLLLPQSDNQTSAKPIVTVSITQDYQYFIEDKRVPFSQLESRLQNRLSNQPEAYISLHADKRVSLEKVVQVMDIARDNNYKLI